MFCTKCGAQMPDNAKFCTACGEKFVTEEAQPTPAPQPAPQPAPAQPTYQQTYQQPEQQPVYQQPVYQTVYTAPTKAIESEADLPEKYKPIKAWGYFGLELLFTIPVVGFIFLIVFSCNGSNINRRNFARSYWCGLIIGGIAFLVIFIILLATGALSRLGDAIKYGF